MSADQLRQLIYNVRKFPELYDTEHEKYKLTKHKDEIWNQIALDCNFKNACMTKKLWKNLRDSHREAIKRLKPRNDLTVSKGKKWKFLDAMSYLEKHMTKREPQSKKSVVYDDSQNDEDVNDSDNSLDNSSDIKKYSENIEVIEIIKANQQKRDQHPAMKKELREKSGKHIENPALHSFFMSMYETTLTFPAHVQTEVKKKIFSIVTDCEETLIQELYLTPN